MFSDYDDIKPKEKKELSEHQYMLLASHMFAFILKDRDYDIVEVDGLVEPLIVVDAINRLVMDPTNKSIIKAIAKTYTDTEAGSLFSADFIHGKGEGQILLLHGPPGTGKTLTAESVAEFTSRPLLSLTAADLGDEPDDLEKHLMQFFKYANDWDAVVLIDEADVYLEARSIENLKRNSVVSVFLRALDYFQGILFLTTNRVGHFDEAFMSRIHVSIGYDRLDDSARAQIWDNLFLKLREDFKKRGGPQIEYEYDAKQYVKQSSEVKRLRWNGREIRNAFQTAVALAVNDTKEANESRPKDADPVIPEIKEKHLAQVVKLSSAFKDYMKATRHNKDESEHAYLHGNRDDTVNTPKRNASEGGTIKRRTE
jgi:SpoVK/Ycf46/Vps4 family AAA+-type ATPase